MNLMKQFLQYLRPKQTALRNEVHLQREEVTKKLAEVHELTTAARVRTANERKQAERVADAATRASEMLKRASR